VRWQEGLTHVILLAYAKVVELEQHEAVSGSWQSIERLAYTAGKVRLDVPPADANVSDTT
jgi:hypothetical protein